MKNKLFLTICATAIFFLLQVSCKSSRDEEFAPPIFPKTYTPEIVVLNDNLLIDRPSRFYLCDSVFVLYAQSAENDNAFQVLSAETGEFIRGFAHHGRGENELTEYYRSAIDRRNNLLYCVDNNNKFVAIDLDKAISGNPLFVKETFSFEGINRTYQFALLNDSTIFNVGAPHFFITDLHTCKDTLFQSNNFTPFPQYADNPINLKLYYGYNEHFSMRPDTKKFVIVTSEGMMLEIFDINNYTVSSSALRKFYEPIMMNTANGTDDCIYGGFFVCSTNNYIYVLYYDTPNKNIGNNPLLGIFDWKGREICSYRLNNKVSRIAITHDDSKAYIWGLDDESNNYLGYVLLQ